MFLFWMNIGWSCCSSFVATLVIHAHRLHCSTNNGEVSYESEWMNAWNTASLAVWSISCICAVACVNNGRMHFEKWYFTNKCEIINQIYYFPSLCSHNWTSFKMNLVLIMLCKYNNHYRTWKYLQPLHISNLHH